MAAQDIGQATRPSEDKAGKAPKPFMASFLDHLVRNGIISTEIGQRAAAWKRENAGERRTLVDLLHEEFRIPREALQFQMAQFYAFRSINLGEHLACRLTPADVLKLVRGLPDQLRTLAMQHKVLPYDLADNQPDKLIVVTPNPSDRETSDVARAFPYKKFEICYVKERDWDDLWRMASSGRGSNRGSPALADIAGVVLEAQDLEDTIDREMTRAQLSALVDRLLADAVQAGAEALHLIPRTPRATDVFIRIDGMLSHWMNVNDVRTEAVAAAVKLKTPGMDRYERLAPQKGVMVKLAGSVPVHLQVSSIPVVLREQQGQFEMLVVQINREPDTAWRLETIGLSEAGLRAHREVLGMRSGLVLLTGPPGSGVTTTMAAMMRSLEASSISALAVEESMECAFEGVSHVRLTPKFSYEEALAVVERHDPDLVILGEIRDRAGADLALRLAMRGRRVFARLLAADTAGAIVRLHGMGVEPYLLANGLTLVHAQRMVRRLCPQCRQVQPSDDPRLEQLGLKGQGMMLYRPVGCVDCVNGYCGRHPLHETLLVTPAIRNQITAGGAMDQDKLRAAQVAQGASTLWQSAADYLWAGATTLDEIWAALS